MTDLKSSLLDILKKQNGKASFDYIKKETNAKAEELSKAITSLESLNTINAKRERVYSLEVTKEGTNDIQYGFPEEQLIKKMVKDGTEKISKEIDMIALGWAKKNGWLAIKENTIKLTPKGAAALKSEYPQKAFLLKIKSMQSKELKEIVESKSNELKELEKRGLIKIKEHSDITEISISGSSSLDSYAKASAKQGQLTREMIKTGSWNKETFKKYDVNASVEPRYRARLHPMHKFIDYVRGMWISMGFTEVKGPIIEPAFWNFDALFSPQDHPTRDMQDTFFLSNPKQLDIEDIELLKRVKEMHETGWKEEWSEELAKQALLRTHATSVSARHINKSANEPEENFPIKLFSIGKVFRNETPAYKHVAEFLQVDGIIIGNALTMANLIYILKEFYSTISIKAQIRPAYFPFVEPGLEVYYNNEKLNDNIELGGAGVIRKEITKAMGTNKTVLAFGLGLDRLMFNYIDLDYLGELYKNNVGWLRKVKEIMPL